MSDKAESKLVEEEDIDEDELEEGFLFGVENQVTQSLRKDVVATAKALKKAIAESKQKDAELQQVKAENQQVKAESLQKDAELQQLREELARLKGAGQDPSSQTQKRRKN